MRFSRVQLQLISISCYLCGLAAIVARLIVYPMPASLLAWSLGAPLVIGVCSFAFSYFKQFRQYKDLMLDYSGVNLAFFVLCRPIPPLAFTIWALYELRGGKADGLEDAMFGFSIFFIFFASHVAEYLRMRQNGVEAES